MKQKMLDEVAKAIIAKNGAPLSVSEHEAVVSKIKTEAAKAHAEMVVSKDMLPNGMVCFVCFYHLNFFVANKLS